MPKPSPDESIALPRGDGICRASTRPMRIGIVGARCQVQGVGEHVARHLTELGATVPAIVGTRRETVAEAQEQLERRYQIRPRGYIDVDAMLRGEELDAVAICSPDRFHAGHLQAALAHRVHVLCEKPLVFQPRRDPLLEARPLVSGFARAGKLLMLNEQWPYTLPAFAELYPDARICELPPRRMSMLLCPASPGVDMIPRAVPHALSLLLALCPAGGSAHEICVEPGGGHAEAATATAVTVSFEYVHRLGRTQVSIELCQVRQQPRPAGYMLDGRWVRRMIDMPGYALYFAAGEEQPVRRIRIEDPLRLLLSEFLRRLEIAQASGSAKPEFADESILERLALLNDIYKVACTTLEPMPGAALS